jgi:hypothetical protein
MTTMYAQPKPEKLKTTRRRRLTQQAEVIRAVHEQVWARDATCRLCLGSRTRARDQDQMHEDPSRAHTRGLPPEQRFNTRVCGRLCWRCHRDVTGTIGGVKIRIVFLEPSLGFNGPIRGELL